MSTAQENIPLSLADLAKRINELAIRASDAGLEFCSAMDEARRRVPAETGMSFVAWGVEHLRKPDGTPWSKWTLYSYASYGADPDKLNHVRASIAAHGVSARTALRALRRPHAPEADQVNALMTAWEAASEGAREQFLCLINVDPMRLPTKGWKPKAGSRG